MAAGFGTSANVYPPKKRDKQVVRERGTEKKVGSVRIRSESSGADPFPRDATSKMEWRKKRKFMPPSTMGKTWNWTNQQRKETIMHGIRPVVPPAMKMAT